jgi:3-hydroxy-3-methylglutaryl CoA synthase
MTAVEWLVEEIECRGIVTKELRLAFEQAKEMEKQQQNDTSKVRRVEVIQHSEPYNGRAYTNYNAKDVEIQLQDDNKTLKIFLK